VNDEAGAEVEFRGGPMATARLLLDCYVRPDPVWESIQPSRPDDEPPPHVEATNDIAHESGQAS
jgi:hypothetical protein